MKQPHPLAILGSKHLRLLVLACAICVGSVVPDGLRAEKPNAEASHD